METKRTAVVWLLFGLAALTFLVDSTPIIAREFAEVKPSSAVKNGNPTYQLLKSLVSTKAPKSEGIPQIKGGQAPLTSESNQTTSTSRRQRMKPYPAKSTTKNDVGVKKPGVPPSPSSPSSPSSPGARAETAGNATTSHGGRFGGGKLAQTGTGKAKAEEEKGRGWTGGRGGLGWGIPLQQQNPSSVPIDDSLRYLFSGPAEDDRLRNGRQQVLMGSAFAASVPPLALAEYLLLTGDFDGFEEALADIVTIGMMAPQEAEFYRQSVGLEYDSLVRQETEATLAADASDLYKQAAADATLSGVSRPFLPPFAIEYPDYGYYGNPMNADGLRRQPNADKGNADLDEMLQQMLESITATTDDGESTKSSDVIKTSPSASSSSSSLEDQLNSLPGDVKQDGGKADGARGGTRKMAGKGKGRGGREKTGASGAAGARGRGNASDAENDLKSVVTKVTQIRTKEANGTKTRRPLSKQQKNSSNSAPTAAQ